MCGDDEHVCGQGLEDVNESSSLPFEGEALLIHLISVEAPLPSHTETRRASVDTTNPTCRRAEVCKKHHRYTMAINQSKSTYRRETSGKSS